MVVVELYALVVEAFSLGSGVYFSPPELYCIPSAAETCCTISRPIRSAMHEPLRRKDAVWLVERPLLSAAAHAQCSMFQRRWLSQS